MRMEAQTRRLNTAAVQGRIAERHRQADGVAADIVAERKKSRALECEDQQTVATLLKSRLRGTVYTWENKCRRFELRVDGRQGDIPGIEKVDAVDHVGHLARHQVEVAARILVELVENHIVRNVERVKLRCPQDDVVTGEIEWMGDLEMRDIINRRRESDLQGAGQMSIPQAPPAKQHISADKKRGILGLGTVWDAYRVTHIAAFLIHWQGLDQPGRKLERHGKRRPGAIQRSGRC